MESYVELEEEGLFYMGAQTVWLPAEHFMNIDNWEDSLKPSAAHYIKQAEEWIASKEEGCKIARGGVIEDISHTMSNPLDVVNEDQEEAVTPAIVLPNPTLDKEVGSNDFTVDRSKPFASHECGKILSSKWSLTQFHRVHSRQKPFVCSQCDKTFSARCNLTKHLLIHSGEKPFACSQCGKTFTQKSNLKAHARIHSGEKPFACNQCGKVFAVRSNLTQHLRVHSGVKPFSCSKCGKAFTQKINLTRHVRIHSGEKPFKCEKCGKLFTRSSYRNQHAKKCNS